MIDLTDPYTIWQVSQTALVVAMLAVMWRLHRRLDSLRDAREEAARWLEQFSGLVSRTETLLRQARQQALASQPQSTEVKQDAEQQQADRAATAADPAVAGAQGPARRNGQDASAGVRIARLEDLLGKLR